MFCRNCGSQLQEEDKFCNRCGGAISINPDKEIASHSVHANHDSDRFVETKHNHVETTAEFKQHDHLVCEKTNKKNTFVGLCWLIAPFLSLIVILIIYSITSFVMSQSSVNTGGDHDTVSSIINVILGLGGVVAVIGIIIGIPLGIITLNKRNFCSGRYDIRSGKGSSSEIPKEFVYLGWNWGAAGLSLLWGMANRVWIVLLMFIPIVNIFIFFYLGFKGNELAWRASRWESVEKFKEAQDKWRPWGILFFILTILSIFFS